MSLQTNWRKLHDELEQLWTILKFKNFAKLHKFLKFKFFKSFYDIYQRNWLNFEKKRLAKQNKFMTREKNIKAIQMKIINEEKHELMKFFDKTSNKFDWNVVNHLIVFMYDVRQQNIVKFNDFFFDFVLNDAEKNRRIWNLIQYVFKNIAESKNNKNINKKNKNKKKENSRSQNCWWDFWSQNCW